MCSYSISKQVFSIFSLSQLGEQTQRTSQPQPAGLQPPSPQSQPPREAELADSSSIAAMGMMYRDMGLSA
jgi:hypothetical protein